MHHLVRGWRAGSMLRLQRQRSTRSRPLRSPQTPHGYLSGLGGSLQAEAHAEGVQGAVLGAVGGRGGSPQGQLQGCGGIPLGSLLGRLGGIRYMAQQACGDKPLRQQLCTVTSLMAGLR